MSLEIKDFITGLREKMDEREVGSQTQEAILDEILTEYENVPGDIREIAWAVLVNSGFIGLANAVMQ
jgi:hypothetical protein